MSDEVKDLNKGAGSADVTKDVKNENLIPYERFAEVNERMKKAEAQLQKLLKEAEEAKKKELEEQGKFKELVEKQNQELTVLRQKAEELERYYSTRREALLSKLPEDQREIYQELSLDNLEKHVEMLGKAKITTTNTTTPGLPGGYKSIIEAAKAFTEGKIKREEYEQIRQAFSSRP